jgi:transcriptional regulator with XRE-family HTH domain
MQVRFDVRTETGCTPRMAELVEPHPKMEKMGERLAMMREDRKLTQEQLAEKAGVSQGAISAYERGERPGIPLAIVMRLVDALDTTIQYIAYGEPLRPAQTKQRYRSKSE